MAAIKAGWKVFFSFPYTTEVRYQREVYMLMRFMLLSAILICAVAADFKLPTGERSEDSVEIAELKDAKDDRLLWPKMCGDQTIYSPYEDKKTVSKNIKLRCVPRANDVHVGDNMAGRVDKPNFCFRFTYCDYAENGTNICKDGKAKALNYITNLEKIPAATPLAIFPTDPSCEHIMDTPPKKIMHRWANQAAGLKKLRKHDLRSDGDDLYVHPPIFSSNLRTENKYILKTKFSDGNKVSFKDTYECNSRCDTGKYVLYETANNAVFDATVHVKNTCEWVQLCLTATVVDKTVTCEAYNSVTMQLKNGFVSVGSSRVAYPVMFEQTEPGSADGMIRFDISRTLPGQGQIVLTTSSRERFVFPPKSVANLLFAFSSKDCLVKDFGVFISNLNGLNLLTDEETKPTEDPPAKSNAADPTTVDTNEPQPVVRPDYGAGQNNSMPPATPPPEDDAPEPQDSNVRSAVPLRHMDAMGKTKSGWLTWACFFGFLAGSTCGALIMLGFFFLCRRTVYGNWYRGMYTRYHCDASGTTGGQTGSAFGNTTQGGTAASQMSTIGTTGGGTTGGDTTGTTGGTTSGMTSDTTGGTTGGGTTGGGTDMVTM